MNGTKDNTKNDDAPPKPSNRRYSQRVSGRRKLNDIVLRDGRHMRYIVDGPFQLENDPTKISSSGLPVVFAFHGMFMSGESVVRRRRPPSNDDYDYVVVAVNRMGYHRSSSVSLTPDRFTYTEFANDIRELADDLSIDRFVVAGHSSGGPNALACAAVLGPDRVKALATLGSDPEYAHYDDTQYECMIDCCIGVWLPRCLAVFVPCLRVANGMRHDYIVEREPYSFATESIIQPALVLAGEEDNLVPPALTKRIHDRLPSSEFVVVPGATHEDLISTENLDETYRRILALGGLLATQEGKETTEKREPTSDKPEDAPPSTVAAEEKATPATEVCDSAEC